MIKLFSYYKTVAFTSAVQRLILSIMISPCHYQILVIFVISIILSNLLIRDIVEKRIEYVASCVIIFLSSLLPIYWAYSGSTLGEQFWAVLFLAMVVFIQAMSVLVRRTLIGTSPRRAVVSLIALPVLVVLAIAWGLPQVSLAASPIATGIRVIEATADGNCEGQRHDATELVRSACTGRNKCAYPVEAGNANGPAGACAKELTVSYICFPDGTRRVAQFSDEGRAGGSVDLSCNRQVAAANAGSDSMIQIRSATYGASCGMARDNATLDLRRACDGKEKCDYVVDVNRLHDPAPGCGKDFRVHYTCAPDATPLHKELPGEAGLGSHLLLTCPPEQTLQLTEAAPSGPEPTTGLRVQTATYGASCGVASGNATLDLRRACGGKADCDYVVDVDRRHDRAPRCSKDFSVDYTCASDATPLTRNCRAKPGSAAICG
jgi:hypothetical protein